jgi:AcrR family transcriptional regulator
LKTRDRILTASLALFNEEGASGLSAVDIAAALGISPGHLYYHFKGKAEIVSTLFTAYEAELALVLDGAVAALAEPTAGLAAMGTQLQILLEETHDMRFLFRETGALVAAFPDLAPRFRRVMSAQYGCVVEMLTALAARKKLKAKAKLIDALARQVVLGLSFKLLQLDLEGDAGPPRTQVARAAAEIMAPIAALSA